MNGNNPLHKKIKNKLEQHEFDFDPTAWAGMESMLDNQLHNQENTQTPNVENTNQSFSKTVKIIGIMTTLLLLLWLISTQFNTNSTSISSQKIGTNSKIEITKNAKTENQNNTQSQNINKNQHFVPNTQKLKSPKSNHQIIKLDTKHNDIKTSQTKSSLMLTDTAIIKNALASYTTHYQNEKVFVHLDKTIYKPTEAVWFNVFVRNSNRFTPSLSEIVYVELVAPNGKTLKTLTLLSKDGMAAGDLQLTDDFVGGLYKIKAYTQWQKNTADVFEKTLQIQKTVLPKLNMKLEFARKAYGAGDEVVADLTLETVTNQALANQDFDFTVSLAGQQVLKEKATTNAKGKTEVKCQLPKDLNTNDGLLNILIPYNGSTESIARSVPIVLNTIDLQFLPEGGDLATNLKSNIAFKAVNEFGQPADIEGEIYNAKGEKVSTFKSYHQGMGGFELLAKANENYTAKITKPVGITEVYNLPLAKAETAILNIIEQTKEKITVRIASNVEANYALTVTAREKIYLTQILSNLNGEQTIEIDTKDLPIGITKLTLFDGENQPISERLAFVNPHQQLNIKIETDKANYKLRETVNARIKVIDENGNPVKGQFAVSVVDETLLSHADDKQANLLAYFLLTSDLKGEVREPNFYFEQQETEDKVDRNVALDYVLLTHGWRRFGWEQVLVGNFPKFRYPHETTKFQGRVVDAFNRPLANAKVTVKGKKNEAKVEAITDAYGNFILNKVGLLPPFKLVASYDKFDAEKEIKGYNQNCQIKLMANYSRDIYGRVVDFRSRNVEGAKIEITGKKMKTLTAVSDKNGNYVIPNVDLHQYKKISMEYQGERKQELYLANYANGSTALFRSQANKISSLTGQTIAQKGDALEGVAITIDGMKDTVYTDAKGYFSLPNVDFSKFRYVKGIYNGQVKQAYIIGGKDPVIKFNSVTNIKIIYANSTSEKPVIQGIIKDGLDEILPFATVKILQNGKVIGGTQTDFEGKYKIENLHQGKYDLEASYVGYTSVFVKGIIVNNKNIMVNFPFHQTVNLNEVVVTYQVPLVEQDNTTQGTVMNRNRAEKIEAERMAKEAASMAAAKVEAERKRLASSSNIENEKAIAAAKEAAEKMERNRLEKEKAAQYARQNLELHQGENDKASWKGKVITAAEIEKLPSKNVNGIVAQTAGVSSADVNESIVVRGSRSAAPNYYIDGIRVSGAMIPQSEIEQLYVMNIEGGLSARFENYGLDGYLEEVEREQFLKNPSHSGFSNYAPKVRKAVEDYGYSVKFKNGYYKARTFYTPKYEGTPATSLRNDFRTTLYWNNAIKTNEKGEANFEFPNGDATTNYRITVGGFSDDGKIGLNTKKYFVQMPFALQTKIPNSILTGDKLTIPVTLMNNTDKAINGKLFIETPPHFELINIVDNNIQLAANEIRVVKLDFLIGNNPAFGNVHILFKSDDFEDAFSSNIQTISRGYPISEVMGDNKLSKDFTFTIEEALEGSLDIKLTVHPNVLSDLVTGIDRMFRQPSGCFEQVSSSNYPNLLALNFLRNTNNRNQKIEAKAERFLGIGYEKMKSYEVEGGGFDWWGKAPAHEGLTAYGLMQLVDMKNVHDVEQDLIDRTAKWLLSRRNGEGGWQLNQRALHSWVNNELIQNAYIVWALTEAGYGDKIAKEIDVQYNLAIKSEDAYSMALIANSLSILNDDRAESLINAVLEMQNDDGSWQGKSYSVTFSQNKNLQIETSALVALAIMSWEADEDKVLKKAIDFISKSKNQYGFGSTQSTVLAMKALVNYAEYAAAMGEDGQIILYKGITEIATFDYTAAMNEPIVFDKLEKHFSNGKNKLKVRFIGAKNALSYDLSVNYNSRLPKSQAAAQLVIQTNIDHPKAMIGETVRLKIELQNQTAETLQSPIAIVGIPSGLTLQPWQLRELQEKNTADYIELWNGYIVFYFREISDNKTIHLDLKAEAAGTFEAPASSAYLYYDNEVKSWSLPQPVEIQ